MAAEVGEAITRSIRVTDANDAPVNADVTPTWAITLPDGSTGAGVAVQHGGTGDYYLTYTTTVPGLHADTWTAVVNGETIKFGPDVFFVRAASPPPLISLDDARKHLGLGADPDRDEKLREYLDAATELVEDHAHRKYRITQMSYEVQGACDVLLLPGVPVYEMQSVTDNGTATSEYTVDKSSGVLTANSSFTGPVVVTYKAGVVSPPARVRQAVRVTLQHLWSTQGGAMTGPRRATGTDISAPGLTAWSLPRAAEELLAPDMVPGVA